MKSDTDKRKATSKNISFALVWAVLALLNGIFSAYVLNYEPKIGRYHIRICSILGVLLTLFTIWGAALCIRYIKMKKQAKSAAVMMIIFILMCLMWTHTVLPYYKDLAGSSKTVTTNSYLVVHDNLYFLDDEGNEVKLIIPDDTADELRPKENYEYDSENNLLKYYSEMTVTYYPESKVIISISAEE